MNSLEPEHVQRIRRCIDLYTSLFYVSLNDEHLNRAVFRMLITEFMLLELAGLSAKDITGWRESKHND